MYTYMYSTLQIGFGCCRHDEQNKEPGSDENIKNKSEVEMVKKKT